MNTKHDYLVALIKKIKEKEFLSDEEVKKIDNVANSLITKPGNGPILISLIKHVKNGLSYDAIKNYIINNDPHLIPSLWENSNISKEHVLNKLKELYTNPRDYLSTLIKIYDDKPYPIPNKIQYEISYKVSRLINDNLFKTIDALGISVNEEKLINDCLSLCEEKFNDADAISAMIKNVNDLLTYKNVDNFVNKIKINTEQLSNKAAQIGWSLLNNFDKASSEYQKIIKEVEFITLKHNLHNIDLITMLVNNPHAKSIVKLIENNDKVEISQYLSNTYSNMRTLKVTPDDNFFNSKIKKELSSKKIKVLSDISEIDPILVQLFVEELKSYPSYTIARWLTQTILEKPKSEKGKIELENKKIILKSVAIELEDHEDLAKYLQQNKFWNIIDNIEQKIENTPTI